MVKIDFRLVMLSLVCTLSCSGRTNLSLLHSRQDLAEKSRYRTYANSFNGYIRKSWQSVLRFGLHNAVLCGPKSLRGQDGFFNDLSRFRRRATFLTRQNAFSEPPDASRIALAGHRRPSPTVSVNSTLAHHFRRLQLFIPAKPAGAAQSANPAILQDRRLSLSWSCRRSAA